MHSTVAMWTSMETPFSLVTQLVMVYGGGVRAKNSNVYISGNTTFTGNSGTDGGGMSAWENSNVYINGHTTDRCVYIACTLYEHTKTATWHWPLPLLQPFSLSSV